MACVDRLAIKMIGSDLDDVGIKLLVLDKGAVLVGSAEIDVDAADTVDTCRNHGAPPPASDSSTDANHLDHLSFNVAMASSSVAATPVKAGRWGDAVRR